MATTSDPRDGFQAYYTEKLWHLIPEVYRNEDGLAARPDVLRQIIEVIAADAAKARRSIDRLWEDQHIETCDDWAVPYIGDLVGARLVSIADRRARRVDVANAIRFRRRRGTPGLLRELVRSFSGWDVLLVEGFQRLARTHHRLSPLPAARGLFTGTPPGGTADLRSPGGADLADSPCDEYYHTLDTRRLRGRDGQFGIRKLNFHLYRFHSYVMEGADRVELTDAGPGTQRAFTIDPSGRDISLFIDADPPEDFCGPSFEWDATRALRCRLLGHVAYAIAASHINELVSAAAPPLAVDLEALRRVLGVRFASEPELRRRLTEFGALISSTPPAWYRRLVELALVAQTGKAQLYPRQVELALAGVPLSTAQVAAADLSDRQCHPEPTGHLAQVLISPELGRVATVPPGTNANAAPEVLRYVYGFSGDLGAGPYPRTLAAGTARAAAAGAIPDGGTLQGDGLTFDDNRSYDLTIRSSVPVEDAHLQASSGRRPLVRLHGDAANPHGANLLPADEGQAFVADGGWYVSSDPNPAPGATSDFVIEGLGGADTATFDFDRFELRHVTLDPGGRRADGKRIAPLRLLVRGQIRRLVIQRSITGPIVVAPSDTDPLARVEKLVVCDSIVDAGHSADSVAIANAMGEVVLEGSTVFGDVVANVLWSTATIVTGAVKVANNQAGCFRFSASSPATGERLPPRHRDVHVPIAAAFFNSRRFGDPDYAQLSVVAPESIARGAENRSEMGAFSHLLSPIRLDSVQAKVDEFGPAGVLAQFLFEEARFREPDVSSGPVFIEPAAAQVVVPPEPGPLLPPIAPPPPAPLPTECPDEADAPALGPLLSRINVEAADLGGAPSFWRESDWTGALELPAGSARVARGIPFDRVEHLIEFDARLARSPRSSGWQATGDQRGAGFRLDAGTLRFEIPAGATSGFAAEVATDFKGKAPSLHAYATLRREPAPARPAPVEGAASPPEASFGLGVARVDADASLGLHAHFQGRASSELDAEHRTEDTAPRYSGGEFQLEAAHWTSVSLQVDFEHNLGIVSQDDRIERAQLGTLTGARAGDLPRRSEPPGGPRQRGAKASSNAKASPPPRPSALWAFFGVDRPGAPASGELQNFVASSPGRFIRAWYALTAPCECPRLRLAFSGAPRTRGSVQLSLRYGPRSVGSAALKMPRRQIEVAFELKRGAAQLELELPHISAAEPLWLTIERDCLQGRDNYAGTVRLLELAFVPPGSTEKERT